MAATGPTTRPAFDKAKEEKDSLLELAKANKEKAEKQKQQEEEAIKADIKAKKKALENRKKKKDAVIQAIPHSNRADGGAIGKAEHLAGLTAEGVAGEMAINLMIFAVELSLVTPFWIQSLQFDEGLKARLAYVANENGDFPDIYPIDAQGKVDYKQPPMRTFNDDGTLSDAITSFHIRANGYVPRPTVFEAVKVVFDRHLERMHGSSVISAEQKARMSNTVAQMQAEDKKGQDLASDAASRAAATAAATSGAASRPAAPTPTRIAPK